MNQVILRHPPTYDVPIIEGEALDWPQGTGSPSPGCPRDRNGHTKSSRTAIEWRACGVLVERPL